MDCGVPFCQSKTGCPLGNVIPKWNDLVFHVSFQQNTPISVRLNATFLNWVNEYFNSFSIVRVNGKMPWIDCFRQITSQNLLGEFVPHHAR